MALITKVSSLIGDLNKTFMNDGTKVANANLSYGTYMIHDFLSVKELVNDFTNLQSNEAFIIGIAKSGAVQGVIGSAKNPLTAQQGHSTRTKADTYFPSEHYLCFDYDGGSEGFTVESKSHYVDVLRHIDPLLQQCQIAVVEGSSNGINIDGFPRSLDKSFHAWIKVINSSDEKVKLYNEYLENNAWKSSCGHIKISKSGSILPRSVIDHAVFSSERIMYEASPTLDTNVTKDSNEAYIDGNGARDLDVSLNHDSKGSEIREQAKINIKPEADKVKAIYKENKIQELMTTKLYSHEAAKNVVETLVENGELLPNSIINSKQYGEIKVHDVFLNHQLYNEQSLLDPLESEANQFNSILYVNDGINMVIHSFKHGGKNYKLIPNKDVIEELCNNIVNQGLNFNKEFVNKIKTFCDMAKIDNIERKQFTDILKQKKIVTRMDALTSHVMKVDFPDVIKNEYGVNVLNTMSNLEALIDYLNIDLRYDVILKKANVDIPELQIDTNNEMNTKIAWIKSEGVKVGLPERSVDEYLGALIDLASENPLLDMVTSKEWDGINRIQELVDCILTDDDKEYIYEVHKKWLIQCVAAWDYARNSPIDGVMPRFEQVLTFVGDQGKNKTKFFESLLPKKYRKYMQAGHHLDTHNKDSVKIGVSAGITELGELDGTFKKDIAALKAFLSMMADVLRLPYAKVESYFKRQTSFCASVNLDTFLVDETGNRRYLPVVILKIFFDKLLKIDKQQLFAQAYHEYVNGTRWWIDPEQDVELQQYLLKKHKKHAVDNAEDDIIIKVIQDTKEALNTYPVTPLVQFKTATQIATFFKLDSKKRSIISKIKKEFKESGIEYKHPGFRVLLKD